MEVVENILKATYETVKLDTHSKSDGYFTIIQIKSENTFFLDFEQNIYKDVKLFINEYIQSVQLEEHGYDSIDVNKILLAIDAVRGIRAKHQLCNFLLRALRGGNYDDLISIVEKRKRKYYFYLKLRERRVKSFLQAIFTLSSYSLLSIIITIFFLSLITLLLIQDAPIDTFALFSFKYENFCDNHIVNQFLNIWAKPFGLAEEFKIIPLNPFGIILLILLKMLYLIFIVNYLMEKAKEGMKT